MKKNLLIFMFLCLWTSVCAAEESDPFLLAATGTPEQLQAAYNRGVRFNANDEADKTPLHDAAISNHNPESIRFLVQQGIDVNTEWQTGTGFTPLLMAVLNYNAEAVEELLKNEADPNFTDGNLSSVLQHAVTLDKKPAERKRIVSALIKAGADVNYHDDISNSSALASAVTEDIPEIVEMLIDAGADINIKDDMNKTAADHARELPADAELRKSPIFARLTGGSVEYSEINSNKDASKAQLEKLLNEASVPNYVGDKGTFLYDPDKTNVLILGTGVRLRSQPNTKARIIAQLNKEQLNTLKYWGEWTHPAGDKWVLCEYIEPEDQVDYPRAQIVWIARQYAEPVSETRYAAYIADVQRRIQEEENRKKQIIEFVRNTMYYSDFSSDLGYGPVGRQLEKFFSNGEWSLEESNLSDFDKYLAVFKGITRERPSNRRVRFTVVFGRRVKTGNLVLMQISINQDIVYRYFMEVNVGSSPLDSLSAMSGGKTMNQTFQGVQNLVGALSGVSPNRFTLRAFLELIYSID